MMKITFELRKAFLDAKKNIEVSFERKNGKFEHKISIDKAENILRDRLEDELERIEEELDELDDKCPDDEASEEYEAWEEKCDKLRQKIEELEDKIDDIED